MWLPWVGTPSLPWSATSPDGWSPCVTLCHPRRPGSPPGASRHAAPPAGDGAPPRTDPDPVRGPPPQPPDGRTEGVQVSMPAALCPHRPLPGRRVPELFPRTWVEASSHQVTLQVVLCFLRSCLSVQTCAHPVPYPHHPHPRPGTPPSREMGTHWQWAHLTGGKSHAEPSATCPAATRPPLLGLYPPSQQWSPGTTHRCARGRSQAPHPSRLGRACDALPWPPCFYPRCFLHLLECLLAVSPKGHPAL